MNMQKTHIDPQKESIAKLLEDHRWKQESRWLTTRFVKRTFFRCDYDVCRIVFGSLANNGEGALFEVIKYKKKNITLSGKILPLEDFIEYLSERDKEMILFNLDIFV